MRLKTVLLPLTMPLVLAACLGGGGGSGGSSSGQSGPLTLDSTPTQFTSFSDITANSLVEASAATSINYGADGNGTTVQRIGGTLSFEGSSIRILTGAEIPPEEEGEDSELAFGGLRLTVNLPEDETITRDFMTDPTDVATYARFEIANDDEVVTNRLYTDDSDELDFMTFGVWALGLGGDSVDLGGSAWGAPTAATALPDGGTVTYNGGLLGHLIDAANAYSSYRADSTIVANFTNDTVTLSSTNTRTLEGGDDTPGLNLTTLTAASISGNGFADGALRLASIPDFTEGTFAGTFYGPGAEEVGGWFNIRNTGDDARYFGSFGGADVN